MIEITSREARNFLTTLHFYDARNYREDAVDEIVAHVKRLGCVQYDPLDVVGRNPDLVMQSRVRNYKPQMLYDALYSRRELVEGFDKNLAIFHVGDYPAFARTRKSIIGGFRVLPRIIEIKPAVLDEIERRGEVCSTDLPYAERVRWPWGSATLARAALESLWMDGELGLSRRDGARRYFDLISRCMPAEIIAAPDPNPADEDYFAWQLGRRIRSVGMLTGGGSSAFLGLDGMKAAERKTALETLLERGEIIPINIADIKLKTYISAKDADLLNSPEVPAEARLIAPLDNFIWDRKLINRLFGFHYQWEVYTPKEKRNYGYYVLPVLCGHELVARVEPAPYRGGALVIKNIWWEADKYARELSACLEKFAEYLGADGLICESGI